MRWVEPPPVIWRFPQPLPEEGEPQLGSNLQILKVSTLHGLRTKSLVSNIGFRGRGLFNVATKSLVCKCLEKRLNYEIAKWLNVNVKRKFIFKQICTKVQMANINFCLVGNFLETRIALDHYFQNKSS